MGNLRNSEYKSYSHRLLVSTTGATTNPDVYWNGTLFPNNSTGPSANSTLTGAFYLGIGYAFGSYYEGNNTNISEFIMYWNQDLTSDATDLNTNTNDYFKMY
jgi:hypothetical protein